MGLLRLLLAISVILFHSNPRGPQMVGGGVAVEAFFIISGFYMSLILDKKYIGANGRYSLFIGNRFLKLYPAYWTVLLLALLTQLLVLTITGYPILLFYQIAHFRMNIPGIAFLSLTNLAIFGQDMVSFFGLNRHTGELFFTTDFMKTYPFLFNFLVIPQGWSLAIELTFYLVAPFILKRKWWVVVILIGAVLLLRFFLTQKLALHYDPWIFRFFPSQLLLFLLGNISYRCYAWLKQRIDISKNRMLTVLAIVIAATIVYGLFPYFIWKKPVYHTLIFCSLPFLIDTGKLFRADIFFGELSYPVYLSHMFVLTTISTLNSFTGLFKGLPANWLTIVFTLLLSVLIRRYVALPVEQYRQRRVKPVAG